MWIQLDLHFYPIKPYLLVFWWFKQIMSDFLPQWPLGLAEKGLKCQSRSPRKAKNADPIHKALLKPLIPANKILARQPNPLHCCHVVVFFGKSAITNSVRIPLWTYYLLEHLCCLHNPMSAYLRTKYVLLENPVMPHHWPSVPSLSHTHTFGKQRSSGPRITWTYCVFACQVQT